MKLSLKTVRRIKENIEGYLFIAPATLLIALFGLFPILFTIFISLHRWRIKMGPFIGLKNYRRMFGSLWYLVFFILAFLAIYAGNRLIKTHRKIQSRFAGIITYAAGLLVILLAVFFAVELIALVYKNGDNSMLDALRATIWYSMGTVPVQLGVGLLVAILLDQKFRGKQFFRVMFLMPYIIPSVAAAAVFERLFSLRPSSFANQLLNAFGAKPLQWLQEPKGILNMIFGIGGGTGRGVLGTYLNTWVQGPSLAMVSIMVFNYWIFIGYYALIFSNGLVQIPQQLYDAAEVDGANKKTVIFKIILPLLSPTTFFLTMIGIIGTFKAFVQIYILRNTQAQGTVDTMSIYIFFTFFRKSLFGYAAAASLLLFAIVLALTLWQKRIMEKHIYYGD